MNKTIWKAIYSVTAFSGLASAIWGHETYLLTFIDPLILIPICLVPTVFLFFIARRHYLTLYSTDNPLFPFLQGLFSAGFITTSLFLFINYYLANPAYEIKTFNTLETGELSGKNRKPYAVIRNGEHTKKLVFKRNPTITSDSKIELKISKGYLGFEVIVKQEIVD